MPISSGHCGQSPAKTPTGTNANAITYNSLIASFILGGAQWKPSHHQPLLTACAYPSSMWARAIASWCRSANGRPHRHGLRRNVGQGAIVPAPTGGVTHLESLVITHYDADHIDGVRDIGKELSIGMVYLPGYEGTDKNYRTLVAALADTRLSAQQVSGQLKLAVGKASIRLFPSSVSYSPGKKGEEGNDNDMSLVAELHYGDDSYLFAGDIEKDGIVAFLQANHGRFDVLKVPHHGNKSPLSDELFESVQPQIAIITDSADEPADKKTLKLLAQNGATAYCTSTSGTVVVQSDGAGHYTVA